MNALSYQMRRHPIATFLILMVTGPYLLAVALIILVIYVAVGLLSLAFTK